MIFLVTVGLAIFFLVLSIRAMVTFDNVGAGVFLLMFGLLATYPFLRASQACAIIDGDRLTIRNVFRTTRVRAHEIRSFQLGPSKSTIFFAAAAVELHDGEELVIFGIQAPNPAVRPENASAQVLVDKLNDWLLECQVREGTSASQLDA